MTITTTYSFAKSFSLWFSPFKCTLYLRGPLGVSMVYLPSFYFYHLGKGTFTLVFLKKFFFVSFLRHLSYLYDRLFNFYFARVRIKGLGYKIRRHCDFLFRFYFTKSEYIYLHLPLGMIARSRRRFIILLSNNLHNIKTLVADIVLLYKRSSYNRRGLWFSGQIVHMRPGKKARVI